jgi:hypothetical protein
MGRKITKEQFNNVKAWANEMAKFEPKPTKGAIIWSIKDNFDIGETTAFRILRAKSYADYKAILKKDHPKKYTFVVKMAEHKTNLNKPSLWQRIKNKFKRSK